MFSLDYSEPANLAASVSMIRKLDAEFRHADLAYKLVDYGPLSLGWENGKPACQPTKAPLAGSQAIGGMPFTARAGSPVRGATGNIT